MNLLHIINNLNKGGAERLLVDTLPLYIERNIKVSLLQLSDNLSELQYINTLKEKGVEVYSLGKQSVYSPLYIGRIRRFLKQHHFDIIHVHLFPSMYWAALAKVRHRKTPMVFTEHSTQNNRFDKSYFKPIDKFIYGKYDKIIAISPAIEEKLKNWTGMSEKISLIRNGVNTTVFNTAEPYDRTALFASLGLPPDARTILMTARFFYPKDHKTVVDALQYLPRNYYVLFAGDAGDKQSVINYVNEQNLSDRVNFLGFRNDVPRLMKSVDINVLSSLYEGMSGVSCEALAAGKPFMGTDVPGINDVVPDNRFLFEKQNRKELAEKIEQVTTNELHAKQMVNDGLKHVQQFDISLMIEKHINIYYSLLRN